MSAADLSELLDDLNAQMDGKYSSFEGGVVRFAVQPGHNEMSLETHAERWKGQFAAAAALWLQLPEHFEVFTVELPYVHRVPSEALLAAVDSLDALQGEDAVNFDFAGGPWRADGATLGVLAVVPADAGMSNNLALRRSPAHRHGRAPPALLT